MTDVKAVLSNIRSLRAFARETDLSWLEDAYDKLGTVLDEKREEAQLAELENQEREEKLLKVKKYMEELGLSPALLSADQLQADTTNTGKEKRPKAEPKYSYTDESGKVTEWSGRGRTPLVFASLVEQGHSMEEFLIEKNASSDTGTVE